MNVSKTAEHIYSAEAAAPQRRKQRADKQSTEAQDKPATSEQLKKEDIVEISEEGRERLSKLTVVNFDGFDFKMEDGSVFKRRPAEGTPEYESLLNKLAEEQAKEAMIYGSNAFRPATAEFFVFNALQDKLDFENAWGVAMQLGNMVFDDRSQNAFHAQSDLETLAENREAGRDLAKYIAENYFDNPDEAKAFMDKIDEYIKKSELRDQGYIVHYAESTISTQPPNAPSDWDRFLYENFDKYFGNMSGIRQNEGYGYGLYTIVGDVNTEELNKAWKAAGEDFLKASYAHFTEQSTPYKVWQGPIPYEECKEMDCDERFSMYSEKNKTWYADFLKKSNLVQDIINNARMITDFSGNEKWNIVMNLLS